LKAAHRYAAKCDGVSQGGRNTQHSKPPVNLAAFEGLQTGSRLNQEQIIEIMRGWNIQNDPPLDESELMRAVQSGMSNGTPRPAKLWQTNT
jgi:hypothetical protein